MDLAEDSKIRPIEDFSPIGISNWCRDYSRHNKYPTGFLERYAIGIYQIHQGMEWPDPMNKAESFMSACLHFLMVCEKLEINVLLNPTAETNPPNFEKLLYLISKIQQQLYYFHKASSKNYQRASRFKKPLTEKLFQELINNLSSIPQRGYRSQGLFHASKIMSGAL